MEFRHLNAFLAAVESGTISGAAKSLHLSQTALSRQIKGMEEELGVTLLERGAHSFSLTPAGELLAERGPRLISQVEALARAVRETGNAPVLRVGFAPSLAADFLPPAIASFTQIHPNARVELRDLSSQEMIGRIENGSLDLIVTAKPMQATLMLQWTPLREKQWRLALPASHPLAGGGAPLEDAALNGLRLLMFCRRDYPEYWEFVQAWLCRRKIRATLAGEYDSVSSLAAAVAAGLGVALVAERPHMPVGNALVLADLANPPDPVRIAAGIPANAPENPVRSVFIEEARRFASRTND